MSARTLRADLESILPQEQARRLERHVEELPDPHGALALLRRLAGRNAVPTDLGRLREFLTLAGFSPHLGTQLVLSPSFFDALPSGTVAAALRRREDMEEDLGRFQMLSGTASISEVLLRFKHREYLRIALADFERSADLPALTRGLSLLADVLLDRAVHHVDAGLAARYGRPTCRDDRGHLEDASFVIIAFGKLGGEELNYSSDIDLMYLFSRDGETSGKGAGGSEVITNREYFTRLATSVTRMIGGTGHEDRVFRVDLDLRPGGRDGDLVKSIGATIAYYRNMAEPWERQALIKARPVAGDLRLGHRFCRAVEPLIYEENPDPYLTVEIGAMKDRIDARLSTTGRSDRDIKLGHGGIREIEFATQALQLQRAGADPWLRQGNTLLALHRLAERGLLGYAEYAALAESYIFLRDLEHRLQLGQDRQTAVLPKNREQLRIIARRMSLGDATPGKEDECLNSHLDHHRDTVRAFYDSVLGQAAQLSLGEEQANPWLDRVDDDVLLDTLRTAGVRQPERVLAPLKSMRRILRPEAVSEQFREALRRNGPHLIRAAVRTRHPRRALGNVEKLFSSLISDPGELPHVLQKRRIILPTIQLLGRSDFLAGLLIRQPGILRGIEKRSSITRTPGRDTYRSLLLQPARARGDVHHRIGELRRRHQAALATIAMRDINRQATLREGLKSQSDLADATLDAVELLARDELAEQGHQVPDGLRIAVLGLGRLGYRELDYGSDLDLVFLQEGGAGRTLEGRSLATRLCEAIVRHLSTLSRDGQLYRVDLRLRPSGGAGDLVYSLGSLEEYVRNQAETWELQSFLKARPVGGDLELGRRGCRAIESLVLERAASTGTPRLARDILEMRRRLVETAERDGRMQDVKLGDGGLLDIHFLIEYLQLSRRIDNPEDKDTLRLLTLLSERQALDQRSMRTLYEGYLFMRALDHEMRLVHHPPLRSLPADEGQRRELAEGLDPSASEDPGAGRRLLESYRHHSAAIHEAYETILQSGT